tara:strand:+ start:16855 stop:17883 length:1029 start_codon:yes stop_codon:yes gene_type:complete
MSEERNARGETEFVSEIVASGYAYPSERVDNATYLSRCQFDIASDVDALIHETQMKQRTWCTEDENTWTMARTAVQRALKSNPALRDEIDVVLVASGTTMPVLHAPEADNAGVADLAPLVLRELGIDSALGLDLKACYCTGFLRGLQVADGLLANSNYRAALVIATEQGSRFSVAPTNRSKFCFIMSDAAGAVVLRKAPKAENTGIVDYMGRTEASKFDWVGIGSDAASTIMRGSRAGEATVAMLTECGSTLLKRNSLTPADVDWLLPIQTHAGIVDMAREALGFPSDKLLWFGGDTGFSGSASIAACLAEQLEKGTIKKGDLVLSIAVGAGMNCGGVLYYA